MTCYFINGSKVIVKIIALEKWLNAAPVASGAHLSKRKGPGMQCASRPFQMVAGEGFEPLDLRVMSPTSYRTALPRVVVTLLYRRWGAVSSDLSWSFFTYSVASQSGAKNESDRKPSDELFAINKKEKEMVICTAIVQFTHFYGSDYAKWTEKLEWDEGGKWIKYGH